MKPTQFIKEVHSALLSVGIDAKLSFNGKGAKIETSFGDASVKWQKTEDGFVINDFDRIDFGTDAICILFKKAKATDERLLEFMNSGIKETSKK